MTSDTVVEFFSLYPEVRDPEPASRDINGSLPVRATQLCTPVTGASAFGWYLYPPADFALRWDGQHTEWSLLVDNEPQQWQSLAGGHDGTLPFAKRILAEAPERYRDDLDIFDRYGGTIPFVDADPRAPDTVELVTGVIARTAPGWWLLVRGVPNWTHIRDHYVFEGIVETDWYRSFLPTIIRLTEQHRIVRFYRHLPIMTAQPIPAAVVRSTKDAAVVRRGLADLPDDVWREFVDWRRRRQDPHTRATYVSEQRDRARQAR